MCCQLMTGTCWVLELPRLKHTKLGGLIYCYTDELHKRCCYWTGHGVHTYAWHACWDTLVCHHLQLAHIELIGNVTCRLLICPAAETGNVRHQDHWCAGQVCRAYLLNMLVSKPRLAVAAHYERPADATSICCNVHSVVLLVDADESSQASCTHETTCSRFGLSSVAFLHACFPSLMIACGH